jgi:hypothetical protein
VQKSGAKLQKIANTCKSKSHTEADFVNSETIFVDSASQGK